MYTRPEKPSGEIAGHEDTLTTADQQPQSDFNYISGWRLHIITTGKVANVKSSSPNLTDITPLAGFSWVSYL